MTNRATGRLPVPRQRPQQDLRPTEPQQAGYRGRALTCVVGLYCTVYSVYSHVSGHQTKLCFNILYLLVLCSSRACVFSIHIIPSNWDKTNEQ